MKSFVTFSESNITYSEPKGPFKTIFVQVDGKPWGRIRKQVKTYQVISDVGHVFTNDKGWKSNTKPVNSVSTGKKLIADFMNEIMEAVDASKYKAYKPRKYKGVKPTGFSQYIRSISQLSNLTQTIVGDQKISLKGIIDLFAIHNYKLADNFTPVLPISELWTIREYDREMVDGYTGKNSAEEMKELKIDIKKNGIKQHGYISIDRRKNGDVEVLLGEGNHRLQIAKQLGIKEMPIMFTYGSVR